MYVLEYSKVSRLDQIVDEIILTSIFKCPGGIRGSCVLLEHNTYPFSTRLPALAPTAHKTTPYQCRQEPLIPKTEALIGKVPQPLTPVVSKRCWVHFQWGRRVFPVSMQQAVTWAPPQSCPHPQPTPGPSASA